MLQFPAAPVSGMMRGMEWGDFFKTLAAFAGLGLGLWNLLAPRWTGVVVRKAPSGIIITNTGSRPIYVEMFGWAKGPSWKPHLAEPKLDDFQVLEVQPWRSQRYKVTLKAEVRAAWPDAGFEPEAGEIGPAVWFVCLEHGAVFTTLGWHHWIARLKLWRNIRTIPRKKWDAF